MSDKLRKTLASSNLPPRIASLEEAWYYSLVRRMPVPAAWVYWADPRLAFYICSQRRELQLFTKDLDEIEEHAHESLLIRGLTCLLCFIGSVVCKRVACSWSRALCLTRTHSLPSTLALVLLANHCVDANFGEEPVTAG